MSWVISGYSVKPSKEAVRTWARPESSPKMLYPPPFQTKKNRWNPVGRKRWTMAYNLILFGRSAFYQSSKKMSVDMIDWYWSCILFLRCFSFFTLMIPDGPAGWKRKLLAARDCFLYLPAMKPWKAGQNYSMAGKTLDGMLARADQNRRTVCFIAVPQHNGLAFNLLSSWTRLSSVNVVVRSLNCNIYGT